MKPSRFLGIFVNHKKVCAGGLGLALCATLAVLLSGYTIPIETPGNLRDIWPLDGPVEWWIWEGFTAQSPNIVAGSQPQLALRESLERWARVSAVPTVLLGTTTTQEVGLDGQNIITIADTPHNRSVVGSAAGVMVGQMQLNFGAGRAYFVDTDVLLNPGLQWSTIETTDFDVHGIVNVAEHEFGHAFSLSHSIARSSSMFFASGPDFDLNFNQLAWDDIAGVNVSYPLPGLSQITGSISGHVTMNGSPVFGAFVTAVDDAGVLAANAISLQNGSYKIQNLPPGQYGLYVEPLDGPTTINDIGGGLYALPMTSNFLPQLYSGTTDPVVQVQAGTETTGKDFQVTQGAASVNAEMIGLLENSYVSWAPPPVRQGETVGYVVAGTGVGTLQASGGVFLSGSRVAVGARSFSGTLSDGSRWAAFPLTALADAVADDGYPVFLTDGTHLGIVSGGFKVDSPWRFLQAFAQFANLSTATSGLFLINTDSATATTGRISLRDANGFGAAVSLGTLAGSAGDLTFNLQPGGSLLANSHGADFVGSLRARGDRRLGGTVLFETPFGTTGVGPSQPAYSFIIPIEVADGGAATNTGVALTNLDTRNARVFLQAQNPLGAPVAGAQAVVDLVASGQLANFVRDLLPALPTNFAGTLMVTSTRRLGGAAIRTAPGVFTTLPVIQNRVTPETYFAQFVHVGGLTSRLILVNPSPYLAAQVLVQIKNSNGSPATIGLNGQPLVNGQLTATVQPLGRVEYTTSGNSTLVGSVRVSSLAPGGNNVPVGGVVLFGSQSFGTTGVGESLPMTELVIPLNRDQAAQIDTGVALVNADTKTVTIQLQVRDQTGTVVKTKTITLQPGQQLARFANEDPLLLGLGATFTGSLWIKADGLIGAMSIRQSPGVLTTFPVITLEEYTTPL